MPLSLPRRIATATCLLVLAALLSACDRTPPSARDPQSAANAFFATLESGDARAAYDGAAFGFQASQTYDGFLSNARALGLIGGQAPVWTAKQATGNECRLDGSLVASDGKAINISVTMTPDGEAWKLFSLQTGSGDQPAENHFTVVGKDTGFNDVYHQPMPSSAELDDLVHKTLLLFAKAILKKDFHDFYTAISELWKQKHSTDPGSTGVTENILKTHFQGFIDQGIDLSVVAGMKPIFDDPPRINEDGLLILRGHFNTKPYETDFFLQYVYELPWWKLYGIDVGLTEPSASAPQPQPASSPSH